MSEKVKILIAEDDKFIGEIYSTKLSQVDNFEVIFAEDGERALNLIKEEKPDLVLLDIMMPKMTGLEVLEAMKEQPSLDDIKVIMLTNINEEELVKRANKARKVDYLIKSGHTPGDVVDKINERLSQEK